MLRYSDYYISGCKQFARAGDKGASFLMSYVACGRPFPVTQHPGSPVNRMPFQGQPCNQHSPCGGGAGRHDSHYVCVKFNGQYFPCPPREQPDYDEIITFNSDVVLPVAAFEFKRRRRTLLWLDDCPQNNYSMLRTFPGCPQQSAALQVQAYPMQQHCTTCEHALTMDPNPNGSLKQWRKAAEAAEIERNAVLAAARSGNAEAQARLQGCIDALRLAESGLAQAQAAAAAVAGEFAGRDIKMEEQTDVVLFTSVPDMTRFLRAHPELSKCLPLRLRACAACLLMLQRRYPPSLLRIISNYKLLHGGGLLDFFDTDSAWRHKCVEGGVGGGGTVQCTGARVSSVTRVCCRYPATLMFYQYAAADNSRVRGRPNFFLSTDKQAVEVFATFKPFALLPSSSSA